MGVRSMIGVTVRVRDKSRVRNMIRVRVKIKISCSRPKSLGLGLNVRRRNLFSNMIWVGDIALFLCVVIYFLLFTNNGLATLGMD
jgi:hypothetical protein